MVSQHPDSAQAPSGPLNVVEIETKKQKRKMELQVGENNSTTEYWKQNPKSSKNT